MAFQLLLVNYHIYVKTRRSTGLLSCFTKVIVLADILSTSSDTKSSSREHTPVGEYRNPELNL
jgi:hypothetical protein